MGRRGKVASASAAARVPVAVRALAAAIRAPTSAIESTVVVIGAVDEKLPVGQQLQEQQRVAAAVAPGLP
jgi:hypothetical protein